MELPANHWPVTAHQLGRKQEVRFINRRTIAAGATALLALATAGATWGPAASAAPVTQPTTADAASVAPPATAAAAASKQADDDEVVVVTRNGLGVITGITRYEPAGSAERLRAQLRARGITGVLNAGEKVETKQNSVLACPTYGTAAAWCNHAWAYNGFNDPQVYFLDHTPAGYPVTNAVADWYQSPGIDAYYRWHTQGCPGGGRHCVHVYAVNSSLSWYGQTSWAANAPNGPAKVELNTRLLSNATQRRKTTCHELGHALGLDHNSSTNSCLKSGTVGAGWSVHPSSQDFQVLNLLYPRPGT
jgi:hypothetical protein